MDAESKASLPCHQFAMPAEVFLEAVHCPIPGQGRYNSHNVLKMYLFLLTWRRGAASAACWCLPPARTESPAVCSQSLVAGPCCCCCCYWPPIGPRRVMWPRAGLLLVAATCALMLRLSLAKMWHRHCCYYYSEMVIDLCSYLDSVSLLVYCNFNDTTNMQQPGYRIY